MPIEDINDDDLKTWILNKLKNDIRDRESFGWNVMKVYDELAYSGYKSGKTTDPWNNASNYAVGLTPTLVDTAHANTIGSIYFDKEKIVSVEGVAPEDKRGAKLVEKLMNWVVMNDIEDSKSTLDMTIHTAFKHGNSPVKVIRGKGIAGQKKKTIWSRKNVWNIFTNIEAKGLQPRHTDHVFELIALDENDWEIRKSLKDDSDRIVYEGIGDLQKGNAIFASTGQDEITQAKDRTSGTSLGDRFSRDMRYILECYCTYPHKKKDSDEVELLELLVTIAPNGGKVFRKSINNDIDEGTGEAVRPYAWKFQPYPREDRAYGDSLCWLIKQSQEELDYAHNQVMNAMEKLVKTPTFYDPNGGFDPETVQQTPNGWYPVPNPRSNIFIPSYDYGAVFQHYRSFDLYWEYAQRRTGLTELFQGRQQERQSTLGEANIRTNKAEIRFKVIYDRLEEGFNELIYLTYFYTKKYMPKEEMIKVLGVEDYSSINEIFPEGIGGKYNFNFSSMVITERLKQREDKQRFFEIAVVNPLTAIDAGNQWKLLKMMADEYGIENFEGIIRKPNEADIEQAKEAVKRIMSGDLDVMPSRGIDPTDYIIDLSYFIKTDTFKNATPQEKEAVANLMRRALEMRKGQIQSIEDANVIKERIRNESQISAVPQNGDRGVDV